MFNGISSGFKKVLARKELVIAVIALFVGVALLSYSGSKSYSLDGMNGGYRAETNYLAKQPTVADTHAQHIVPAPEGVVDQNRGGYNLSPVANASDLLPKDPNSEWAQLNPGLSAGAAPDLLSPGQYIGISSAPLRNSNLQFRSDPVIPRQDTGPWMQSTIEQDISRVPLEIGYNGGCSK